MRGSSVVCCVNTQQKNSRPSKDIQGSHNQQTKPNQKQPREIQGLTHSWSWALLEKLPIVQLLENYPAFYGNRRFITAFTRALPQSLSWARSIQLSRKCGDLDFSQPYGPPWPVTGIALPAIQGHPNKTDSNPHNQNNQRQYPLFRETSDSGEAIQCVVNPRKRKTVFLDDVILLSVVHAETEAPVYLPNQNEGRRPGAFWLFDSPASLYASSTLPIICLLL
jgi:hypothetical protein